MPKNFWKTIVLSALLPVGAVVVTPRALQAQNEAAKEAAAPQLTVVAGSGLVNDGPATGKLDIGAVDLLVMPKIERDFVLRNDNKTPVTIGRLQASCGCTSVVLGDKNETTKTLAPGEEIKVRASLDVVRFRGPIQKAITVYAPDDVAVLSRIEISANIQEPAAFSNRYLDFGRVNFGAALTRPLEVALSPRLLEKNIVLKLVSSSPALEVIQIETPQSASSAAKAANNVRRYVVKVAPRAPIGPLHAVLGFEVAPATAGTQIDENISSLLGLSSVAVSGEIIGKIAATPSLIILAARDGKQQVAVTGEQPKKLKVKAKSGFVVTKWLHTPKDKPHSTPMLEISLSPRTPPGTLETEVIITSEDGETLRLPLIADVPAAK